MPVASPVREFSLGALSGERGDVVAARFAACMRDHFRRNVAESAISKPKYNVLRRNSGTIICERAERAGRRGANAGDAATGRAAPECLAAACGCSEMCRP